MRKKPINWALWAGLSFAVIVLNLGIVWLLLKLPGNMPEQRTPANRAEMIRLTRAWGRLAPFPEEARDFEIRPENNALWNFIATFIADKPVIEAWIKASPGLREAKPEERTNGTLFYRVKPGGGAAYAGVTVDYMTGAVFIKVMGVGAQG